MKIALMGTHGVGKTTLCFELAANLKRRGLDVEIVREVARHCPLPINQQTTREAQEWILHTQMAGEIEAAARHEVVLCDRSVLDNYCYMVHGVGSTPEWERMLDRWIPTYDLLVYVPMWIRPTWDGVRAVEPGFQEQIDLLLEGMISVRGLTPLRLPAQERDSWSARLTEAIASKLDPTLPLFGEDELDGGAG